MAETDWSDQRYALAVATPVGWPPRRGSWR
jgi:hypothetical protein